MKKYLLTLAAVVALTSAYAASDNANSAKDNNNDNNTNMNMESKKMGPFKGWRKSMTAEVVEQGKNFQLNVKTKADMPNASDLEISSISVISPTGIIPGALSLTLRPAGDAQVTMVGPQHGSFTFTKGDLPQGLPNGRYLLTVNGEVYGMLVLTDNKSILRQGLKPQAAGEEQETEQPATQPTVPQPTTTPQPMTSQPLVQPAGANQ